MPLKKGFTLIEILVVISVLGVLAGIVLTAVSPNEQFAKANDASRKTKVSQLGKALEAYYVNHDSYPVADTNWMTQLVSGGDLPELMAVIPGNKQCEENNVNGFCYATSGNNAYVYTYLQSVSETSLIPEGQGGEDANVYFGYSTETQQACHRGGSYTVACNESSLGSTPTPTSPSAPTATPTTPPVPTNTPTNTPTPTSAPTNLIANPSFETNSSGYPANWWPRPNGSWDNTVAHTGVASLKVIGPQTLTYSFQNLNLTPSQTYTFSVWIKRQNILGQGLQARWVQLTPATVFPGSTAWLNGTADWQRFNVTFTVPSNHLTGRFDVQWNLNAGDVGWFDDVSLCQGTSPCN